MPSAAHFEAKKHAYRQTQDGIVISFVVHPNDVAAALATAPLGTRYMVAFAQIGDDEKPVPATDKPGQSQQAAPAERRRWSEMSRAQQAGILCSDPEFQRWAGVDTETGAAEYVRTVCHVHSRADLDIPPAYRLWDSLVSEFRQSAGREPEQRG